MQSRSIDGFDTRVIGTNGYDETAGSDVCVITAGLPRKPGMSRMDLLEVNAKVVGGVARELTLRSPDCVLIVVSNPLDEMTALAAIASGLPKRRVMGQAGILDTARFKHFVAEKTGVSPTQVDAMTLGSHGETMVPVPSVVTVAGRPLAEVLSPGDIEDVVKRTREGGAEVVGLLKTGSAYYAPSAAAAAMVEAVATDSGTLMPVCAWVEGEFGLRDMFLDVPARIGRGGVIAIEELALAGEELAALRAAGEAVRVKQADIAALATG